jgi:hypothetical protein
MKENHFCFFTRCVHYRCLSGHSPHDKVLTCTCSTWTATRWKRNTCYTWPEVQSANCSSLVVTVSLFCDIFLTRPFVVYPTIKHCCACAVIAPATLRSSSRRRFQCTNLGGVILLDFATSDHTTSLFHRHVNMATSP